jgi:hypothetical protein
MNNVSERVEREWLLAALIRNGRQEKSARERLKRASLIASLHFARCAVLSE